VVSRFSTDEIPILRLSATSNLSPAISTSCWTIAWIPILSNVSGVGSVSLIGAQQREVQVVMDNDKLKAYGMSAARGTGRGCQQQHLPRR
jgi:HAE1 family hydrophobic/amphiphilic exporter-1